MKILKKSLLVVFSIILSFTVLIQTVSAAFVENKTLYVKDLKIIYADSEKDAKAQLPDGYSLVPDNINAETGELGVYICYSTTDNRDEAITDIKVMHESGGFHRTDFKSSLDEAIDGVYGLAQEMMTAINEFIQNYNNGVPAAVFAKEALNYFKYDDTNLLGDFMLSGKGTYKDYGKMILMCHEDILNPILSLLALGVQQKDGENWIDRLADVDPPSYDSSYDMQYRDRATKLRPVLQQFNDLYCYVLGYYDTTYTYNDLTDENDKELFTEMAENKDIFLVIQTILQGYTVGVVETDLHGDWTAEDMFAVGLNETINLYDIYALIECLTPGQEIMLRLTGPYNFIIGSQNTEEVLQKARETMLENLETDEKIPIWEGVNLDIFEQEVGLTNDAQRSIAAGKQYDIFAQDIDTLSQKYKDIASIISSSFTIASCAVLVTKCALVLAPKLFSVFGAYSIAGAVSSFASAAMVTTIISALGISFTVITIVCSLIMLFFIEDIIAWMLTEDYDRSSIPAYMVDEVVGRNGTSTYAYYKRVDNVKTDQELELDTDENECGADINANEGYRWMALYTTDKSSVGNPIKADFLVTSGSGLDVEGYAPLSMFGTVNAVNLNSFADKESTENPAIYLHYDQDRLTPVESETVYISHIRVESGIHEDEAKTKLMNSGYLVVNHDFGSKKGESTFIGYKLTANPNDAVRDIRLFYNCNGSGVKFGELNYGAMGKIGNYSVMVSSTNSNPAPPVVGLEIFARDVLPDASLGLEPVNEFSGGMAEPLGRTEYRLFFLPETTYTSGPDYLAGIETDVYYYNTYSGKTKYVHPYRYYEHEDIFGNNVDNYRAYKSQNYGEKFFDFNSSASFYFQGHENADSHNTVNIGYKYTTTKNPYRAIYGIAAAQLNGLTRFEDTMSYGKENFILAAAEFSSASRLYTGSQFIYSPEANESEFGDYYSDYSTNTDSDLRYYTSINSSGKADAYVKDLDAEWNVVLHSHNYVYNQDITQSIYNDDMNALYISGYQSDRTPLTVNDVIVSSEPLEESAIPANFTTVTYMAGASDEPANIAPSNGEAKVGYYGDSLVHDDIYVTLYNKVYMYFRNEKTVNGKAVAQGSLRDGKYISALYIASKEEIRENYNKTSKTGEQILCENIGKAVVENNLLSQGATTTYTISINSDFYYKYPDAGNSTYVGIQRSDNINEALRDIRLYIAKPGETPEKEIKRSITYNGKTFDVTYTRVSTASLTEKEDKTAAECAKERQVYVYVSSNPALGAPITEIKMDDIFSYYDFEPVLTMDNKHLLVAMEDNLNAGGAPIYYEDNPYNKDFYPLYGNMLSFKREGGDKPYIQNLMIADYPCEVGKSADVTKVVTKLLREGYYDIVDKDLNELTTITGNRIYIGMTRTADPDDAVYDLIASNNQKKNPEKTWNQYTLVSDIDLNKKAWFGPYIYLYQSKKKVLNSSPMTDLKVVNEKYVRPQEQPVGGDGNTYTLVEGTVSYVENYVMNQDFKNQDFNEGAGGEYIYLVMTNEVTMTPTVAYIGSMIGPGSLCVIGMFLVAALAAGILVFCIKKRDDKNKNGEDV